MEHECFEDTAVANLMNSLFVSVKIDREERPDLDNYYMTALQMMTGQGGWPLNIIALPDGRPVWGATYLPKERWMNALQTVYDVYANDPQRVIEYAQNLADGIKQSDSLAPNLIKPDFVPADLQDMVENWKRRMDNNNGGPDKAPKFPLPANYDFLLRYGILSGDEDVQKHVNLTLEKMALGGIYDQIGGGFARYSVDGIWKVPHFEKMLYDNAQLVSLYSNAHRNKPNALYKQTVLQTIAFLNREMRGNESEYFAALDADSEGEEGKFYVWTKEELTQIISPDEWNLFATYFNINPYGLWEHGNYIPLRLMTDDAFAVTQKISTEQIEKLAEKWRAQLLDVRNKRTRPALDTKALTAWNAMMVGALVDAASAFDEPKFAEEAIKTAAFIQQKIMKPGGELWHTYSAGKAKIDGFLDDYAHTTAAWLKLYQYTGNEKWLHQATEMTQFVLQNFDAGESGLFYFARTTDAALSQSIELSDNVIPSSNAVMAHNLHLLGVFLGEIEYLNRSKKMAMQVKNDMYRYGEGFGHWAALMLQFAYPTFEVAIAGPKAEHIYIEMNKQWQPNLIYAWSKKESELPLLAHRFNPDITRIFVCQGNACKLPVEIIADAWQQIKQ